MTSKVFVIHRSEIVRKGLSIIIKELFQLDALLLTDIAELNDYGERETSEIILLVDSCINEKLISNAISQNFKSKFVKSIHILDLGQQSGCESNCDCCFPLEASKERIFNLINPYLKSGKTSKTNKNTLALTARETEVLTRVATGNTNKEIADDLSISFHTVISHRKNITEKLGIKSISGLTVYAILNNLIDANTIDPETLI